MSKVVVQSPYDDMSQFRHWPDVDPVFEKFWRKWGWCCRPFKKFVMYPAAYQGIIGRRILVPIDALVTDYARGKELIDLYESGQENFQRRYKQTAYYRRKLGLSNAKAAEKFTQKFLRLLDSYKKHGWVEDPKDLHSIPWLFRHRHTLVRQDGYHRGCVLRYYGHKTVKVNEIRSHECVKLDFPDKEMRKSFMSIFA